MNNILVFALVCLILYYVMINKTESMDDTVFLDKNYQLGQFDQSNQSNYSSTYSNYSTTPDIPKDTFAENYWDFADVVNMSSNYEEDGVDRMNEILLGDGLKQYKGKTIAEVYDHIAGGSC